MNNYQWIWQYARKYGSKAVLALILLLLNAGLIVVNPLVAGQIVDQVITQKKAELLVPLLGVMVGITLFRTIIRYAYQMMFERIGQNTLFELRQDMYQSYRSWILIFSIIREWETSWRV